MKEIKKIEHALSAIREIFKAQIKIGYTTLVCIPDFNDIDVYSFEAETGDKTEISKLCADIIRLYDSVPNKNSFDQAIFYKIYRDLSETFILVERDKNDKWHVIDGIFDTKMSDAENKSLMNQWYITFKDIDDKNLMQNSGLIHFVRELSKKIETTTEPPTGTTLHTELTPTRLEVLYDYLTDEQLINTTPEMWRFWFTKQSLQAGKKPVKIQWLGAGSVLSNVTMLVCGNFTNHTETAMKAAFKLQSGTNYQQPTPDRNNRGKYPYKRIYEIKEHAETKLQS